MRALQLEDTSVLYESLSSSKVYTLVVVEKESVVETIIGTFLCRSVAASRRWKRTTPQRQARQS